MPIYFYKCTECNEEFDFFHMKSNDVAQCPKCECKDLTKLPTTHVTEIFNFRNVSI